MALKIGMSQRNVSAPKWYRVLKVCTIVAGSLLGLFISPMPEGWIPSALKVYMLTISGSLSGFFVIIEPLIGESKESDEEVINEDSKPQP